MPKEGPTRNKKTRLSPYPLRSTRSNKHKEHDLTVLTEGPEEWKDVQCVICMEPPHDAIFLNCSSFSKGCRPYMCDSSACFKQFRKNNRNCLNPNTLKCPLCRGEVDETKKLTSARRFFNAKVRSCTRDGCEFSGTCSQLKRHMKVEHPGLIPEIVEAWEQMAEEVVQYHLRHTIRGFIENIMRNPRVRSYVMS